MAATRGDAASAASPAATTGALIGLLERPIGDADRQRAALHVLDWIGCAAAGALTPPGASMLAFARGLPAGPCPVVGGLTLTSRDAALVNGALGNVLEMDDFYRTALVHPGPVVVPTALALAGEIAASGPAALDAVVRGFEVMIRIGRSVGPTHYRHFHNTSTCGVFGAAAAAGSLLGLNAAQMADALGNAGTQASGLWQCRLEDTMSKQLHNGRAAQSGLLAAQLATHGFTGAHAILEGPLGFYSGMCPDALPQRLLEDAGGPWLIHATSFKPWPACRHVHPTIDAALAVRGRIDRSTISAIVVEAHRDAIDVCDNPEPRTPVQAKFSLQHGAAVVLTRGRPALEDFEMPSVQAAEIRALRAKVSLRQGERFTQRYPAHFGAAIHVQTADGGWVSHAVDDALGDPENPLDAAAVSDKARMLLAAAGHSAAQTQALIAASLGLPSAAHVGALMTQLR